MQWQNRLLFVATLKSVHLLSCYILTSEKKFNVAGYIC